MNQPEIFELFSVMQKFKRLNIGVVTDELSRSECMLLGLVRHKIFPHEEQSWKKEEITVSDLAARLSVTSPAVSKMIGMLEERELLERYTDKTDRRNKYVRLTKKGEALLTKNEKIIDNLFHNVIERMGRDKIRQLIHLLNEMGHIMEEVLKEMKE